MSKRFPIKLPPWYEKYLIWWAEMKGMSKTSLSQNSLQTLIEENVDQIEVMLRDRAGDMDISVEELKSRLLEKNNFSPADEED